MTPTDCTIHLLTLKSGFNQDDLLEQLDNPSFGSPSHILKGRSHGWVHRPHRASQKEQLLAHNWDFFLLTRQDELPGSVVEIAAAHLSVDVSMPTSQYNNLESTGHSAPQPIPETPPLPQEWPKEGGIPEVKVTQSETSALQPGELRLDRAMAEFLTTALPAEVFNAPVSLLNLFKYPGNDSSIHNAYMEGFKNSFGNTAGARVKFMGPVRSSIKCINQEAIGNNTDVERGTGNWNEANLTQYDSIWHYAYMLSTDVYTGLNKQKIEGLEDTCILCVSEFELLK